jgi:hypothetical protein
MGIAARCCNGHGAVPVLTPGARTAAEAQRAPAARPGPDRGRYRYRDHYRYRDRYRYRYRDRYRFLQAIAPSQIFVEPPGRSSGALGRSSGALGRSSGVRPPVGSRKRCLSLASDRKGIELRSFIHPERTGYGKPALAGPRATRRDVGTTVRPTREIQCSRGVGLLVQSASPIRRGSHRLGDWRLSSSRTEASRGCETETSCLVGRTCHLHVAPGGVRWRYGYGCSAG